MNIQQNKSAGIIGRITDIQRFSVHDGPGIRTTVFLKGCNLHCEWCHNPETISFEKDTIIDMDKCIHCGKCSEGCFSGARRIVGSDMSAEEVLREIFLDFDYYGNDGGVTVSGGEPCMQSEFTKAILELCRDNNINTAVETNLTAPREKLLEIASMCNTVMCDVKIFDSELHREYTGMGNEIVFENLKAIDALNIPIIVRTPVISGINDNCECIDGIASFLKGIKNLSIYELLPYHKLGLSKTLEGKPAQKQFETPDKSRMQELAATALRHLDSVSVKGERIK